jgi:hypothetical protein
VLTPSIGKKNEDVANLKVSEVIENERLRGMKYANAWDELEPLHEELLKENQTTDCVATIGHFNKLRTMVSRTAKSLLELILVHGVRLLILSSLFCFVVIMMSTNLHKIPCIHSSCLHRRDEKAAFSVRFLKLSPLPDKLANVQEQDVFLS